MKNQTLIKLIEQLRESNLVPSKQKTTILANFTDNQAELFLNLKENGFVKQNNLNYVIGEIAKIKESITIDKDLIKGLYYFNVTEINPEILKFILNELKSNVNVGLSNINKLSEIKNNNNSILLSHPVDEIINNSKLRELGLISSVLDIYIIISKSPVLTLKASTKLNEVILNKDIIKSFKACKDKQARKLSYYRMLLAFSSLVENLEYFDSCHQAVAGLLRSEEIKPDGVSTLLYSFANLEDNKKLGYLESIVGTIKNCDSKLLEKIVDILNSYKQESKNEANLAWLTVKIYENLENKLERNEIDKIYNQLIDIINKSSIAKNFSIKDVNNFLIPILDNKDFIEYCKNNEWGYNFIKCALFSGKIYLDCYSTLATNNFENTSYQINEKILNSFKTTMNLDQLQTKAVIYSSSAAISAIYNDINVLRKLNYIIDDELFVGTDGEFRLLQNQEFLESDFFKQYYVNLVHSHSSILRKLSIEHQNTFFSILKTFNFDEPNLMIYLKNSLIKDEIEMNKIYQERRNDRNGALSDIQTSLYEILNSNDTDKVEEYIKLLTTIPENFNIKADTKIIYQKQIGKKK